MTEELNRHWFERNTGQAIKDVQYRVQHPVVWWMAATLDGIVEQIGAVLPWSFSEEAAADKYMRQLQHNMWVTNATAGVLSVITGGGKWVEIKIPADRIYQHLLLTAEKGVLALRRQRRASAAFWGRPRPWIEPGGLSI